jgi:hypothetical protein
LRLFILPSAGKIVERPLSSTGCDEPVFCYDGRLSCFAGPFSLAPVFEFLSLIAERAEWPAIRGYKT